MQATRRRQVTGTLKGPLSELREIIDALQAARGPAPDDEQRDLARLPYVAAVRIRWRDIDGAEKQTAALSRNISKVGMSIVARRLFGQHQQVKIELPLKNGRRGWIRARLVHCRYIERMCYEVGVQFLADDA